MKRGISRQFNATFATIKMRCFESTSHLVFMPRNLKSCGFTVPIAADAIKIDYIHTAPFIAIVQRGVSKKNVKKYSISIRRKSWKNSIHISI